MQYSINSLEKITGIKAHTIRMWEKRYNIVSPKRTKTNIRYYDNDDLKRLLNIRTLNKQGCKISHIAGMDDQEIIKKVMDLAKTGGEAEWYINNLTFAMVSLDEEAFSRLLGNALLKVGFDQTVTSILYPFLDRIGLLWQTGNINPAQEHFITNLVRQKLISAIDGLSQGPRPGAKTFLLFLPEGELHELGLLYFNYLLRKDRYNVIYLGQSVPFEDLSEVVRIRHADYLFTSFLSGNGTESVQHYIIKLSEAFPNQKIIISGQMVNHLTLPPLPNVLPVTNRNDFDTILTKP